ncbi:unnamed protein product [Amoebophrya sp. A25]|nr:unnamed protein product [Amoebophrya sp. A25]|eukprot:GSA25T00015085001.1
MGSYAGVKMIGCETMATFCYNHEDALLHFTEPMGRSITSCLAHNHFRCRHAYVARLLEIVDILASNYCIVGGKESPKTPTDSCKVQPETSRRL